MAFDFPSSPSEGQVFNAPSGPSYIYNAPVWKQTGSVGPDDRLQSTLADMSIGFKTAGNRFVVNDGPSLNGTDVMTVSETGAVTTNSNLSVAGNLSVTGTSFTLTSTDPSATSGPWTYLYRDSASPAVSDVLGAIGFQGRSSTGIQREYGALWTTLLDPTNASEMGSLSFRTMFNGTPTVRIVLTDVLAMTGAISATGNISTGAVLSQGTFSATGATAGMTQSSGLVDTSRNFTTTQSHYRFYNPNGQVGNINTSASATAYVTSSDERLKSFTGLYDPQEAIRIIRADPVRAFNWKAGDIPAIGWGAQTSYAVDPGLAVPPPDDEPDGVWGIDQGKRTPYLWAALSHALDRIDQLEARIAALEGV